MFLSLCWFFRFSFHFVWKLKGNIVCYFTFSCQLIFFEILFWLRVMCHYPAFWYSFFILILSQLLYYSIQTNLLVHTYKPVGLKVIWTLQRCIGLLYWLKKRWFCQWELFHSLIFPIRNTKVICHCKVNGVPLPYFSCKKGGGGRSPVAWSGTIVYLNIQYMEGAVFVLHFLVPS